MNRRIRRAACRAGGLTALIAVLGTGCRPEPPGDLDSVSIVVVSPMGGRLYSVVERVGPAHGARVGASETERALPPDTVSAIFADAARVLPLASDSAPTWPAAALTFSFRDGRQRWIGWPVDGRPRDETVYRLAQRMLNNRVGGW